MTNILDFCPPRISDNVIRMSPARSPVDSMTPREIPRPVFMTGDRVLALPVATRGTVRRSTWIGRWMHGVEMDDGTTQAFAEYELEHDGGPDAA